MPNGWRTINSLVHKIRLHGRRGKGMAESFSRQKSRHAPQKEGGLKILCDLPPVWPRLVRPTNLMSRMDGKKTHTRTHITAQSDPVILSIVILCHSHWSSQTRGDQWYLHVCIFIKLHITAQSGPVIRVILCHSHWSSQGDQWYLYYVCSMYYACMYIYSILVYSKSKDQPGKVANPARHGQLIIFLVPIRAWEFGLARRFWQSGPISACSSPYSG